MASSSEVPWQRGYFLERFGTSTLLWRVLRLAGYPKPPSYFWTPFNDRVHAVTLYVKARPSNPPMHGWIVSISGSTLWESAEAAAFQVLKEIGRLRTHVADQHHTIILAAVVSIVTAHK